MANTHPDHWFLSQGSFPRRPRYTSGNKLEVPIYGEAYMANLAGRIVIKMVPGKMSRNPITIAGAINKIPYLSI